MEDLMESEEDESLVADLRRMMIRMFKEFKVEIKENMQKQLNEYQGHTDLKKLKKTQKQLNEFREDFNKLQNETKENILKGTYEKEKTA
jgi:predicted SpoU family rRNA methylase